LKAGYSVGEGLKRPVYRTSDKALHEVRAIEGVMSAEPVTGPYDVVVRIKAFDLDRLGKLVVVRIQSVAGITRTLTCPIAGWQDRWPGGAGELLDWPEQRTKGVRREGVTMATGVVKWFNRDRGYGFISPDDGSKDVFVHSTAIAATGQALEEGQRVEFEVTQGEKGPQAANVRPIG